MWRMIGIGLGLLVVGALAIQLFIQMDVALTGRDATRKYGGDRVTALAQAVECDVCPMKDRNRAVWALGEMKDRRALPALRRHYSGAKCDHGAELCQYELDKAIRKIEGTWGVLAHGARPR